MSPRRVYRRNRLAVPSNSSYCEALNLERPDYSTRRMEIERNGGVELNGSTYLFHYQGVL
ncbi:hypothetical protein ACHAWO_001690 [Cyclotella atomus]|uniref:Uncharacterized protein n=1 Tax=Cyclotella atomus TaxID=382360 RepID=A0ABD3Q2B2_9STRA